MVVLRHLPQIGLELSDVDTNYFDVINSSSVFFSCFRMQCFFVITGYCSNFDKTTKPFFSQNFKYLILAGVLYGLLGSFICNTLSSNYIYDASIKGEIFSFIYYGSGYWFLSALFISKVLYFILHKMGLKNIYIFFVSILLLVFVIYIFDAYHSLVARDDNHFKNSINFWYIFHAMYLFPFICIGRAFRKYNFFDNKYCKYISILFPIVLIPLILRGIKLPSLTYYIGITRYDEIPLYFLLAISGSCLIIQISKLVSRNSFFLKLGKNSLLIYTTHSKFLILIESTLFNILSPPNNWFITIVLYLTTTIVIVMIFLTLINAKDRFKDKYISFINYKESLLYK